MLRDLRNGRRLVLTLAALLASLTGTPALADLEPRLRVDAGGHTAQVRSLLFTPDGARLVTAGADKDIRIWNVSAGRTERILRGQISEGDEGEVNALALSSDGRTLAVGGLLSRTCPGPGCGDIRLFDIVSGEMLGVIAAHQRAVMGLAFAPDGRRLASSSTDRTIKIWDVPERRQVASLASPEPKGRFTALSFLPDGNHLVAASDTASVHVLSVSHGGVVKVLTSATGAPQHVIAVSSDGTLIASAGEGGSVNVWRWPDATPEPALEGGGPSIWALSFGSGPTARLLVASQAEFPYKSRVFDLAAGGPPVEVAAHDNTVSASAFMADGAIIATTGGEDHAIRLWSPRAPAQPESMLTLGGVGRSVHAVGFLTESSGADSYLAWGHVNPCPRAPSCPELVGRIEHVLRITTAEGGPLGEPGAWPRPEGSLRSTQASVLRQAQHKSDAGELQREQTDAKTTYYPRLVIARGNERRTVMTRGPTRAADQMSYSFDPSGRWIASGGRHGVLDIVGTDGKVRERLKGHASDVNAVAIDKGGRLIASGSSDQTVKLWSATSGELVATLLYLKDGRWILWTPQGYYAASPEGEKLIGWQFNRGSDKAADYLSAYELRSQFYNPALVAKAIELASAEEAVKSLKPKGLRVVNLSRALPPRLWLVAPSEGSAVKGGRANVRYVLSELPENPLVGLDVSVNGSVVDARQQRRGGDITLDIPLHEGVNHVRIVIRGKVGTREEMLLLRHAGRGELDRRGRLFVVAIGVSRYPRLDGLDLTYTVADAREFLATIKQKLGPDHDGGVVERLLVSGAGGVDEPTRDNIVDALSLFQQAGERDTVVLFVAGHGWNHPGTRNYVFLPTDAEFEGDQLRPSRLVPWTDIESAVSTKGLRLLFVDTCRSQSSYNERLINDSSARDIVVYSASGSEHEALEDANIKHGYFTYALIEGLKGKAALEDGAIYATTLYDYVFHDVRKRSHFVQEPQFYKSAQTRNLVLARRHSR